MGLDPRQLAASVLTLLVAASAAGAIVYEQRRSRGRTRRAWYVVLLGCAIVAMASWFRFGDLHAVFVDADGSADHGPSRRKIERHQPLHFHEFVHYYVGSKYFRELGYLGLYDCLTLADQEIAREDAVPPRVSGYVRDLDDVLTDKPYEAALAHCRDDLRPRFSPERWDAFKHDVRELQRLAPDGWWTGVVGDAGFNPPPSWVAFASVVSNAIPIRAGAVPTYLLSTSLDLALLALAFAGLRRWLGTTAATLAVVYFGGSFISSYGWNGGAFLRFTWVTSVILGLAAMKRERWALAGALLGAAICDRIFPAGFAAGAALALLARSAREGRDRRDLARFLGGMGAVVAVMVVVSVAAFGVSSWVVFFSRILRHGDVYYVMHIGLKKVLTFRDWVYHQNFHGHEGMIRFHDWNLRLRQTWASTALVARPLQAAAAVGVAVAATRLRPQEAALLAGVVFMYAFNLPANYYYVVLVLVPAVLLYRAATARGAWERGLEYAALVAFNGFWMTTLLAVHLANDDIVYDYYICLALLVFLVAWIGAWIAAGRAAQPRRVPAPGRPGDEPRAGLALD
jgi:hypothetical protein